MPTTKYPTAEGTNSWTNPSYARADDSNFATCAPAKNGNVAGIWTNFGFTDPGGEGSVITKVEIGIKAKESSNNSYCYITAQLSYNGGTNWTTDTTILSTTQLTTTSDTDYVTVDVTDGRSWTWSELSNTYLQCRVYGRKGSTNTSYTISMNVVRIVVTYSDIKGVTDTITLSGELFAAIKTKKITDTLLLSEAVTSFRGLTHTISDSINFGSAPYSNGVPITITGSSDGEQTDYQVKLTIYSGVGSNSGSTIYLNNNALNWPYDVKFFDSSGNKLYSWRRSYDASSGVWYVKVPTIPASPSTTTIYVKYGRAGDADESDGTNTFIKFYDCSTLDPWTVTTGGSGTCTIDTGRIKLAGPSGNTHKANCRTDDTLCGPTGGVAVGFKEYHSGTQYVAHAELTPESPTGGNPASTDFHRLGNLSNRSGYVVYHALQDGGSMTFNTNTEALAAGTNYLEFGSITGRQKYWKNDSLVHNYTYTYNLGGNLYFLLSYVSAWDTAGTYYFDDVFVRKFVANEPSLSAGSEMLLSAETIFTSQLFSISDTLLLTEEVTGGRNALNKYVTDTLILTEQIIQAVRARTKTVPDSLYLTEQIIQALSGRTKTVPDSLYLTDTYTIPRIGKTVSDGLYLISTTWPFRKKCQISGSPDGDLTNYQIKVTVNYGLGVDTATSVYLNGLCKTNFNDVRFYDSDGTTPLDFWMESVTNGSSAVFWVEVPSITQTGTTILYLYFGNLSVTSSESDGEATFPLFDHFDGTVLDTGKWTNKTGHSIAGAPSNSIIEMGDHKSIKSLMQFGENHVIRTRTWFKNSYTFVSFQDDSTFEATIASTNANSSFIITGQSTEYFPGLQVDTYHVVEMRRTDAASNNIQIYFESDLYPLEEGTLTYHDDANVLVYVWNALTSKTDWVLVRKITQNEPTTSWCPIETVVSSYSESIRTNRPVRLNDAISLGDYFIAGMAPREIADALILSDVVTTLVGNSKATLDALTTTDVIRVNKTISRTDTLTLTEALKKHRYLSPVYDHFTATDYVEVRYRFKKSHVITQAAGAGTDYQVRIETYESDTADSGPRMYFGDALPIDRITYSDVHFLDSNGDELPCWREWSGPYFGAIWWVKIPDDLSAGDVTIYVCWGRKTRPNLDHQTRMDDVFIWSDHFNNANSSKWNWPTGASVSSSIMTLDGNYVDSLEAKQNVVTIGTAIRTYAKFISGPNTPSMMVGATYSDDAGLGTGVEEVYGSSAYFQTIRENSTMFWWVNNNRSKDETSFLWHETRRVAGKVIFEIDSLSPSPVTYTTYLPPDGTDLHPSILHFPMGGGDNDGSYIYVDWVIVRKFVETEPGHGAWSSLTENNDPNIIINKTITNTDVLALTDQPSKLPILRLLDTLVFSDSVQRGKNIGLTDLLNLTDAVRKGKSLTLTDTILLTDLVSKSRTSLVNDVLYLTDSITRPVRRFSLTDTLLMTDAIKRNKTLRMSDALYLVDSVARPVRRFSVSDAITLADFVYRNVGRTVNDTLVLTDLITRPNRRLPVTDSMTLSDLARLNKNFRLTDSIVLSDIVSRGKSLSLSDALNLTDVVLKKYGVYSVTDAIALSSVVSKSKSFSLTDAIGLFEAITRPVRRLPITDNLLASDSILLKSRSTKLNDALQLTDTVVKNKSFSLADSLVLTDIATRPMRMFALSDAIYQTDAVSRGKQFSIPDVITTADLIRRNKSFSLADSLVLTDIATRPVRRLPISDNLLASDSILLKNRSTRLIDALQLTDTVVKNKSFSLTDAIGLFEAITRPMRMFALSDAIYQTDAVSRGKQFSIPDVITTADLIRRNKSLSLTDAVSLEDSISRNRAFVLNDALFLTDVATRPVRRFSIPDALLLSDSILIKNKVGLITDSLTLTDAMQKRRYVSPIIDTISLSDVTKTNKLMTMTENLIITDVVRRNGTVRMLDSLILASSILKQRYVSPVFDTVNVTDSLLAHKRLSVVDSIVFTENIIQESVQHIAQVLDALGIVDSVQLFKIRSVTDNINLGDSVALRSAIRSLSDALSLIDATQVSKRVVLTDLITLLEDIDKFGLFRQVLDVLSIQDSVSVPIRKKIVQDFLNLSDNVLLMAMRKILDVIIQTDTILIPNRAKRLADSLMLSEIYLTPMKRKGIIDAINLADLSLVSRPKLVQDTINLIDATLRDKTLRLNENVAISDGVLLNKSLLLQETLNLLEQVIKNKSTTIQDLLHLTDSVLRHKSLGVVDTVAIAEQLLRHKNTVASDGLVLTDATIKGKTTGVGDGLSLTDSPLTNKRLVVSETMVLLEQLLRNKSPTVQDDLLLIDTMERDKSITISDVVSIADVYFRNRAINIQDAVYLNDALTLSLISIVLDSVGTSESLSVNKDIVLQDVLLLNDAFSKIFGRQVDITDVLSMAESLSLDRTIIMSLLRKYVNDYSRDYTDNSSNTYGNKVL